MRLYRLFLIGAFLLSVGAQANQILNVQFGDPDSGGTAYIGPAVIGSAGDQWNLLGPASSTGVGLVDPTGADQGMTLAWTADGDITSPFGSGFDSTQYINLMQGYLYASASGSITVFGLQPNAAFDLFIYSQGDIAADGRMVHVNANGVFADTIAANASTSTFILGQNYLELTGNVDGTGQLNISFTNLAGEANINGFQLDSTVGSPEPSTLALLAIGFAGLAWRKRRQLSR